jgi:hypothetical protein
MPCHAAFAPQLRRRGQDGVDANWLTWIELIRKEIHRRPSVTGCRMLHFGSGGPCGSVAVPVSFGMNTISFHPFIIGVAAGAAAASQLCPSKC